MHAIFVFGEAQSRMNVLRGRIIDAYYLCFTGSTDQEAADNMCLKWVTRWNVAR